MATTREQVRELVKTHPHLNQTEIAERVGVSRERVRQIVSAEGFVIAKGVRGTTPRSGRQRQAPQPRVITGGVAVKLSHTIAGTIGELLAAADLMARGFMVFFPLARTGHCDLIALDQRTGKTERIEVRCGKRVGGLLKFSKADTSRSDRHAIVVTGEPVHYRPPFE